MALAADYSSANLPIRLEIPSAAGEKTLRRHASLGLSARFPMTLVIADPACFDTNRSLDIKARGGREEGGRQSK